MAESVKHSPTPPRAGKLSLSVTGEMDFNTFGHQALATFLTPTTQNVPTIAGGHAFTKAKLLLAGPLGWLVGAFRHNGRRAEMVGEREADSSQSKPSVNRETSQFLTVLESGGLLQWMQLAAGNLDASSGSMHRKRLHFLTRQPMFTLRCVLVVLVVGVGIAWVVDNYAQKRVPLLFSDHPESGASAAMDDVERKLLTGFRIRIQEGTEDYESASADLARANLRQDRRQVFADFISALWLEGRERVNAQKSLQATAAKIPEVPLANEMLGDLLLHQSNFAEAIEAYVKEGGNPASSGARHRAMEICIAQRMQERLGELRKIPDFEKDFQLMDYFHRTEAAALCGNYLELLQMNLESLCNTVIGFPVQVFLALLGGFIWYVMLHQLGGVSIRNSGRNLLAVFLGAMSPALVLFVMALQEHHGLLKENGEFINDLLFYVCGVGVREELAKLCAFLPLLWLLRSKSEADILVTAGCVGLGFAVEENVSYFATSSSGLPLGRLLSANFVHIALTAMVGLAAARWMRFPKSWWEQGVGTLVAVIVIHGAYDFFIASPVQRAELVMFHFSSFILIFLAHYFLTQLKRVRNARGNGISPMFSFLVGTALLCSAALLSGVLSTSFVVSFKALIDSGLDGALLIFMFCYHLRELS